MDLFIKKGGHFLAYALLATLAYRARPSYRLAFWLAVLYAISDEFHQSFVPGRTGMPLDVFIDSMGGLAGLAWLRWRTVQWGRKVAPEKPQSPAA